MKKLLKIVIALIFIIIGAAAIFFVKWYPEKFGEFNLQLLLFHAVQDLDTANTDAIKLFIIDFIPFLVTLLFLFLILFLVIYSFSKINIEIKTKSKAFKRRFIKRGQTLFFITVLGFLVFSIYILANELDVVAYYQNNINYTDIYEVYYVDPKESELIFPEEKRNIIHIVLESMDYAYADYTENDQKQSLIPNLTLLSEENFSITNTGEGDGLVTLAGASWTIGSLVSQTSGVPLSLQVEGNSVGKNGYFLPGVYNFGDILADNGYNNAFILGSDAAFAGRDVYYSTHGNYDIYDYYRMKELGKFHSGYHQFWGYEDLKLFEYAKELLLDLASQDAPFNLELLTVDSHFMDGYVDASCPLYFEVDYANAISCSDQKIIEFVRWIQEQDFYENTTIVIVGDHYTMNNEFLSGIDATSSLVNMIINPYEGKILASDRTATALDIFPTMLSSIGVEIPGSRLGLGTDLFSDKQTLVEEFGFTFLNQQLVLDSEFYHQELFNGKVE